MTKSLVTALGAAVALCVLSFPGLAEAQLTRPLAAPPCTIAAGATQHVSYGGTCGFNLDGSQAWLTDADDKTDCADLAGAAGSGSYDLMIVKQNTTWECIGDGGSAGSGDIQRVFECASGDCRDIGTADGDRLDFSSVVPNTTSEGIILPQSTSCIEATAEGQTCWDSDDDLFYIGDGVTPVEVGGGGGSQDVYTKAQIEVAAATAGDHAVLTVRADIPSSAFTGLTANMRADTHVDLDDDTLVDTDVANFATYCDGATCAGVFACIIDGPVSVSPTPEGECQKVDSVAADHLEFANPFSMDIIDGTYYSLIDPIKVAPTFPETGGGRLTIRGGPGGKLSAGDTGAGVILMDSGENAAAAAGGIWPLAPLGVITYEDLTFEGTDSGDAYDIAIFMADYVARANYGHRFINIDTTQMDIRNADPQAARTGGTAFYEEINSLVASQWYGFQNSVLAAQIPVFAPDKNYQSYIVASELVDSDNGSSSGFADDYRDQCMYIGGAPWQLSAVDMAYCGFLQFVPVPGHAALLAFNWQGGSWVGAEGSATGNVPSVPAVDSGTATGTQTATTLVDTSKAWTVDALIGRWVKLRPAGDDYEHRQITDNDATSVTVSAWDANPVDTSDAYSIHEPWHKRGFLQAEVAGSINLDIIIEGYVANADDPVRYAPLVFWDSEVANPISSSITARVVNSECGLTGDPGASSAADHVLVDGSVDNTAELSGVDIVVTHGTGTIQADAECNPIIPFGGDVLLAAQSKGVVRADGKEWRVSGTDVTERPAGHGIPSGAAPAAVCLTGDLFLDTDETDDTEIATTNDNSVLLCVATDTWAVLENN